MATKPREKTRAGAESLTKNLLGHNGGTGFNVGQNVKLFRNEGRAMSVAGAEVLVLLGPLECVGHAPVELSKEVQDVVHRQVGMFLGNPVSGSTDDGVGHSPVGAIPQLCRYGQ